MTEKRYSLGRFGCYRTRIVIDNKNGHELGNSIVVERLNVLHEENEQLKTTIQQLRTDNTKQKKLLNTTMKENEQLRQELHIYHKLASCSNCNYHDYDWYDDGDEFEVCRKGNDVTERICKDWREL